VLHVCNWCDIIIYCGQEADRERKKRSCRKRAIVKRISVSYRIAFTQQQCYNLYAFRFCRPGDDSGFVFNVFGYLPGTNVEWVTRNSCENAKLRIAQVKLDGKKGKRITTCTFERCDEDAPYFCWWKIQY